MSAQRYTPHWLAQLALRFRQRLAGTVHATKPPPALRPDTAPDTEPAPVPADLSELYARQAEQLQQLQRQAQLDLITGLPSRRHFLGLLQQGLDATAGPGAALLLLRVQRLDSLNQHLGFEATDRLLAALGQVLQTYVDHVPGTCAGRLNGSDFALCLPVAGVARETAASLHAALAAAPALRGNRAEVAVGGVDAVHLRAPGAVLAAADAALAQAEARGASGDVPVVVETLRAPPGAAALPGERAWRAWLISALDEDRLQLQAVPVLDAAGRLLQLMCRLQLQPPAGEAPPPADTWVALARRCRLLPQTDLRTITLALQAIGADGQARVVPASSLSLMSSGFVAEVSALLAAAPAAAACLHIDCTDALGEAGAPAALAAAAQAWRPWAVRIGVQIGLGTMADVARQLPVLKAAGVRSVRLDTRALRGLVQDAGLRAYVQSLVALVQDLGLVAAASAVDDAAEAQVLWGLGVSAASGAALRPREVPALSRV